MEETAPAAPTQLVINLDVNNSSTNSNAATLKNKSVTALQPLSKFTCRCCPCLNCCCMTWALSCVLDNCCCTMSCGCCFVKDLLLCTLVSKNF